jgi:hypothetical protein
VNCGETVVNCGEIVVNCGETVVNCGISKNIFLRPYPSLKHGRKISTLFAKNKFRDLRYET